MEANTKIHQSSRDFRTNLFRITTLNEIFFYEIKTSPSKIVSRTLNEKIKGKIEESFKTSLIDRSFQFFYSRESEEASLELKEEVENVKYDVKISLVGKLTNKENFLCDFIAKVVEDAQLLPIPRIGLESSAFSEENQASPIPVGSGASGKEGLKQRTRNSMIMNPYQENINHTLPFSVLACYSYGFFKVGRSDFIRVTPAPIFSHHHNLMRIISGLQTAGYQVGNIEQTFKKHFILRPRYPPFNRYYLIDSIDFEKNAMTFEVKSSSNGKMVRLVDKLSDKLPVNSEKLFYTKTQPLISATEFKFTLDKDKKLETPKTKKVYLVPELFETVFKKKTLAFFGLQTTASKFTGIMFTQYLLTMFTVKVLFSDFAQRTARAWGVTISSLSDVFHFQLLPDLSYQFGGGPPVLKKPADPPAKFKTEVCMQKMLTHPSEDGQKMDWAIVCSAAAVQFCQVLLGQWNKLLHLYHYPFAMPKTYSINEDTEASWTEGLTNKLTQNAENIKFVVPVLRKASGPSADVANSIQEFLITKVKKPFRLIFARELEQSIAAKEITSFAHQVLHSMNSALGFFPWSLGHPLSSKGESIAEDGAIVAGLHSRLVSSKTLAVALVLSEDKKGRKYSESCWLMTKASMSSLAASIQEKIAKRVDETQGEAAKKANTLYFFYERSIKGVEYDLNKAFKYQMSQLKKSVSKDKVFFFRVEKQNSLMLVSLAPKPAPQYQLKESSVSLVQFSSLTHSHYVPNCHPCFLFRSNETDSGLPIIQKSTSTEIKAEDDNMRKGKLEWRKFTCLFMLESASATQSGGDCIMYKIEGNGYDKTAQKAAQQLHCQDYSTIGFGKYPAPIRYARNLTGVMQLAKGQSEWMMEATEWKKYSIRIRKTP